MVLERKSALIDLLRLWPMSIYDRLGLTDIGIFVTVFSRFLFPACILIYDQLLFIFSCNWWHILAPR